MALLHLSRRTGCRLRSAFDAGAGAAERGHLANVRDIGRSTVPVLLPFDVASYLDARITGAPTFVPLSHYQSGFNNADLFEAGPSGYDAVFTLPPDAGDGLPSRVFARPVEVQLTGSLLDLQHRRSRGRQGRDRSSRLPAAYPDIRRFVREGYVRYSFTRFGVPYVVSILCLDSVAARAAAGLPRGLPGRRALHEVAAHCRRPARRGRDCRSPLMRPSGRRSPRPISAIAQPATSSRARAIAGTAASRLHRLCANAFSAAEDAGLRQLAGIPQDANRATGRSTNCAGRISSYIWQDNFCEGRSFDAGQCPGGCGHQGQDIRPAPCAPAVEGADRCDPRQQAVVAVRDGVVIRARKQQAASC